MYKKELNLPKKRTFTAPASLLRRVASYIIDFFIIDTIITYPFEKILNKIIPENLSILEKASYLNSNIRVTFSIIFFTGIITIAYFTYFEYKIQQTPGKMIMKNFIIPKNLTFKNYLISNITFAFFPLWLFDMFYMFFSTKNQRFMEQLTNIIVMQKYEG